jgi:bacterioferritin-associated ferredoxin
LITVFIILFINRMYVCVCNAVTDREVDQAIEDGALTRDAVTKACGAGGDCGACHEMICDRIEAKLEARAEVERTGPVLVPAERLVRERAA